MCLYSSARAWRVDAVLLDRQLAGGAEGLAVERIADVAARADGGIRDVASCARAPALLIVTLSDGCLQMLLAVTVQTTSTPGTTLPAGTSFLVFSPLSLTTSCSTSAVDLRTMQPCGACANACEPKPQAMQRERRRKSLFPLNSCVSPSRLSSR